MRAASVNAHVTRAEAGEGVNDELLQGRSPDKLDNWLEGRGHYL